MRRSDLASLVRNFVGFTFDAVFISINPRRSPILTSITRTADGSIVISSDSSVIRMTAEWHQMIHKIDKPRLTQSMLQYKSTFGNTTGFRRSQVLVQAVQTCITPISLLYNKATLMSFYLHTPLSDLVAKVADQPDEIELHIALIKRYVAEHQIVAAIAQTVSTDELMPGNPHVLALQAFCLFNLDQPEHGAQLIDKVVRRNATTEFQNFVVNELVPLFCPNRESLNAGEVLQRRIDQAPEEQKHVFERARSLWLIRSAIKDDPSAAIQLLHQHIEGFPDDLNAELILANMHLELQQNETAESIFRSVIDRDPQSSAAYFGLAMVVADNREAIEYSRRGLRLSPRNHGERYNLGVRLLEDEQWETARNEWSRIPADEPVYVNALSGIAECYEAEQDYQHAVEYREKAAILSPHDS